MESLIYGLAGMSVGLVGLVVYVVKNKKNDSDEVEELKKKISDLEGSAHALATENRLQKKKFNSRKLESELREQLKLADQEKVQKATQNDELNRRLEEQVKEQEVLQKQMQEKFENLANKILEQKSAKVYRGK